MKIYRGAAAAARHYVEADRSRADDYYLAEGSGIAMRLAGTTDGVAHRADMDGETYERWVAGYDVDNGAAKGRLRTDHKGVRFVEVTVNGPKTWSLAAALQPDIAEAYDVGQMAAAAEIIGWLGSHATTRVGPRGRQVQVPVEQIEAAVVRHFTSRAGDPHRHLHLQINARVLVSTGSTNGMAWRGLHTVGVRDSLEAINGIGHSAVMTNPEFRETPARQGFTLDAETGEVVELAPYTGAFSARAKQIEANIDTYEAAWRADHPGEEPGPALRQAWDRRAWADARPDKVVPTSGEELRQRRIEELHELGYRPPAPNAPLFSLRAGAIDRDGVVDLALVRLGSRRSAWNAADARGEVERIIASSGGVVDPAVRRELAEDLTARVIAASQPLLGRSDEPEHVRTFTSTEVLAVEYEIVDRIIARAEANAITVIEGAAGAGKTARLAATRERAIATGRRMVVVTPTLKAAQVAEGAIGAASYSAAWLLHQHGFRWDENGRWSRVAAQPDVGAGCGAATCSSLTRPGWWTRTPPGRCSAWPTRPRPSWCWWATAISSRPSVVVGCWIWRSGTHPVGCSSSTGCAASRIRAMPSCRCGCGAALRRTRCSTSSSAAARSSSTPATPRARGGCPPRPASASLSSPTPASRWPGSTRSRTGSARRPARSTSRC